MKRLLGIVVLICILFCGCGFGEVVDGIGDVVDAFGSEIVQLVGTNDRLLTAADSTVKLNIYPDGCDYTQTVGGYLFNQLSPEQQSCYIKIDNAIFSMQTGEINVGNCSQKDFELIYQCVRRDRPEYFWLPMNYSWKGSGSRFSVIFAESESEWLYTAPEREKIEVKIKRVLTEFSASLSKTATDYESELAAHDWLAQKATYNKAALSDYEEYADAWSIKGAFVDGRIVCEGYTKAMQVLLNMLGIENTPATGVTDGPHMWNMVKLDGEWYHLDVTSNDTDRDTRHFFFNVTDENILCDRTIYPDISLLKDGDTDDASFNYALPKATSLKMNYYVKNGTYVSSADKVSAVLTDAVLKAMSEGKDFVELGFAPSIGVAGMDNVAKGLALKKNFDKINTRLQPADRIRAYSWATVDGASAIVIYW